MPHPVHGGQLMFSRLTGSASLADYVNDYNILDVICINPLKWWIKPRHNCVHSCMLSEGKLGLQPL